MKILIVNINLSMGGAEQSLVAFLNLINYDKYEIDLLLLQKDNTLLSKINSNVKIINAYENSPYLDCSLKENIKNCIKDKKISYLFLTVFLSILKGLKIDIYSIRKLFPNAPKEIYPVAIAYKQGKTTGFVGNKINAKIKITRYVHGKIKYFGISQKYYQKVYKKFDYIITLNDTLKNLFKEKFKIDENKLKVISNTQNPQLIIEKSNDFTVEKNTQYVFSTVGRVVPIKGFEIAIDVAEILILNGLTDFKWYFIGGAKNESYEFFLKKKIKEKKLENNILFTGSLENPYPYIKASHIYLHPSLIDAMPNAIIEALTIGTPVLATKTIGACKLIEENANGMLSEINAKDFAKKLISFLNDIDLWQEKQINFSKNNEELIKEYYKLFDDLG